MSTTDLDRYLTDERVGAATHALRGPLTPHRPYGYGVFEAAALASLSAVLPDIIQQAKAEVLESLLGRLSKPARPYAGNHVFWEGYMRAVKAGAWDEGYLAGHEDARAVQPTYPQPTLNPHEQGGQP